MKKAFEKRRKSLEISIMEEQKRQDEQLLAEENERKVDEMFDETMRSLNSAEYAVEKEYPVLPLRGQVAFPETTVSIEASRPMTVRAIELAA